MKTKKLLSLLFLLLLIASCNTEDEPEVIPEIPIENIEDDALMAYLLYFYDTNKDGIISKEEALEVKSIDLEGGISENITSLSGLENFPFLETLSCSGSIITSLDISQNKHLKQLSCNSCSNLTSLDLSQNEQLEELSIEANSIENITFSNTPLKKLFYAGVNIKSLDITQWLVEEFDCSYSGTLKSLNAKGNPYLKKIICKSSDVLTIDASESAIEEFTFYAKSWNTAIFLNDCVKLKEIEHKYQPHRGDPFYNDGALSFDVNGCTALTRFSSNLVGQLKITGCTSLKELECIGTFPTLDCTDATALERIYAHSTQLKSIDITSCGKLNELTLTGPIEEIDLTGSKSLERLTCITGGLTSLDVTPLSQLKHLEYAMYNANTPLDLKQNKLLEELILRDTTISGKDVPHRGLVVQAENHPALKKISCESNLVKEMQIKGCVNLEDIEITPSASLLPELNLEGCMSLKKLHASHSLIESLDVSHCPQLDSLIITDGSLSSLKLNEQLRYLNCNGNQLTTLDISNKNRLIKLDCSYNQIRELKVDGCPDLTEIYCSYNEINALNVDSNTDLQVLDCDRNKITALTLDLCTKLSSLSCADNQLTALDVSKNKTLNNLSCNNNPNLALLYLYRNHTISHLSKDNHTSIVFKD